MSQNPLSNRQRVSNNTTLPKAKEKPIAVITEPVDLDFLATPEVWLVAKEFLNGEYCSEGRTDPLGTEFIRVSFIPADKAFKGDVQLILWPNHQDMRFIVQRSIIAGNSDRSTISWPDFNAALRDYQFCCTVIKDSKGYNTVKLIKSRKLKG